MLSTWMRNRRRRRLRSQPFPSTWQETIDRDVRLVATLTPRELDALRRDLQVFIAEKNWEGCGGLTLTEAMKATIAAQACLLLLGMEHDYFERVLSILVYPSAYRDPGEKYGRDGLIDPGGEGRLGEAWYRGPVVLSWDAIHREARDQHATRNLVIHEFAHQLDFLDGYADGTPPLKSQEQSRRWQGVMTAEYERLIRDSQTGHASVLDEYGTTNPAEFFAVATEAFFVQPQRLQQRHPQLYVVLREYFGQDTAFRLGK